MDTSDESDVEFEGFTADDVARSSKNLLRLLDEDSDINLSENGEMSDSDDDVPLAFLRRGVETIEDEDAENGGADDDRWISNFSPVNTEPFTGNPGAVDVVEKDGNELDFFHKIFPANWYRRIADETNRYAAEKIRQNGADPRWFQTREEEIKAFFALQITMSIIVAPNTDMYFTSDNFFRPTGISERITRDRFDKLCQYFHVSNTSTNPARGEPGHDKIPHVRPILENIRAKCKTVYSPHCEVSIDEAMIGFTGRLGFKQYVPLKPTKRGIKVWMRADPHNGFVNDFQVYTGKTDGQSDVGLGERIVKDLSHDILGRNHHVYCDNYFTSVPLFEYLLEHKTYACGTFRVNRKHLPAAVTKVKLKNQGDLLQQQRGQMVATAWHDKRTVHLLTTNADPTTMDTVQRRKKDGTSRDVPCPKAIKNYTTFMNGVDRADQLRAAYSISRKSVKWWKYIFWFLVDICIVNSFIMMKESANHQMKTKTGKTKERTQLDFRKKLAKQLLGGYWLKRKRESVQDKVTQGLLHWPAVLDKKRTCKHCSKQGIRRAPTSGREQCQINLCVGCFMSYHRAKFPDLFQ